MVSAINNHPYGAAWRSPALEPVLSGSSGAAAYANSVETGQMSGRQSSVSVTLSPDARTALAAETDARTPEAVVSAARVEIDRLLAGAKVDVALKDGKSTIDMSGLDRRTLWAVASNLGGAFPIDEQAVAALALKETRDQKLAGPAASLRITGDYADLYRAALSHLNTAGPEERASAQWKAEQAVILKGLDHALKSPGPPPAMPGDPVAAYLKEIGGVVLNPRSRDIGKLAADVRSVLDRQYAAAGDVGADRNEIDFSRFDSRSLAAVSLNSSDLFSDDEIAQAGREVRARSWDAISQRYAESARSSDPSAFGRSLITDYSAMSLEERSAAGWTPAFYEKLFALHNLSEKLSAMFEGESMSASGGSTLLDYL